MGGGWVGARTVSLRSLVGRDQMVQVPHRRALQLSILEAPAVLVQGKACTTGERRLPYMGEGPFFCLQKRGEKAALYGRGARFLPAEQGREGCLLWDRTPFFACARLSALGRQRSCPCVACSGIHCVRVAQPRRDVASH